MFKRVGIIGFLDNPLVVETVKRLAAFLDRSGFDYLIEEGTKNLARQPNQAPVKTAERSKLGENCDLVIVVGGDGSMLHAARDLAAYRIPLLGINRGRLGFLTDISPTHLETQVADVLAGHYVVSPRFLLECELIRDGKCVDQGLALNDVVLQPTASIRMIEFSLSIDSQYVYTQRADGLIICTPTGSTAYALSGGGPILHPAIEAIGIVPINPHTLSNRPIVVSANSRLVVDIPSTNNVQAQVVCDGQRHLVAMLGDQLRVQRHATEVQLIHPREHDFYRTCRTKLNWAND